METRPILVLAGLLATSAVVAEVYRWVDEDGVVHFSDTPIEGAESVDVSESRRTTGARVFTPPPRTVGQDEPEAEEEESFRYDSFSVASPADDETLWNIEGTLSVSLSLSPPLQRGHQVRVYLNGTPTMVNTTSFTLDEVFRGAHTIQAEVLDETGKLMMRTEPNRFYVQQNTLRGRAGP